jgi:hypothetical protein
MRGVEHVSAVDLHYDITDTNPCFLCGRIGQNCRDASARRFVERQHLRDKWTSPAAAAEAMEHSVQLTSAAAVVAAAAAAPVRSLKSVQRANDKDEW